MKQNFLKNALYSGKPHSRRRYGLALRLRLRRRLGFSLLEMALAITIVAAVLITSIASVVSAMNIQIEADRLALAMALVQTKMAELRSDPELAAADDSGEFTSAKDVYYGYRWQTQIKEENINVSELLEQNFDNLALDDQLPAGIQNDSGQEDSVAKSPLASLGDIPILRITVTVQYPKGGNVYGKYHVETLQRSQRSRLYQR